MNIYGGVAGVGAVTSSAGSNDGSFSGFGGGGSGVTPPDRITGYDWHGLHQAIMRDGGYGVYPSGILNAFHNENPVWQEDRETYLYKYKNVKLALNTDGVVVSVMANHRSKL